MSLKKGRLESWVENQLLGLPNIHAASTLHLSPLSGDAGFRQYFLVNCQPSLLAVSAPLTDGVSESASYFAELAETLLKAGVPAPQVLACDEQQNFLLIENFGDQAYLDVLTNDSADVLYGQALMVLLRMQQIPKSAINLPTYNKAMLLEEMELFDKWFVNQLLAYDLSDSEYSLINKTYNFLIDQALLQPQVLVHRDYHSRNIIFREGEAPGVIDFQDAVWGPITYDVVSLLKDCYVEWSPEQVDRWLMSYGNLAIELELLPEVSADCWRQWFNTMGLQRHIKVLGIFARLSIRDAKHQYLVDLNLVWRYTMDVAKQYPETQAFYEWCQDTLLPLIEKQEWYQSQGSSVKKYATGDCA